MNDENILNYSRLMTKVNNYETTAENRESNSQDSDTTNSPVNPDMFTEEIQIVGSASPFKELTKTVIEEAMKKCERDSKGSSNQFFSEPLPNT